MIAQVDKSYLRTSPLAAVRRFISRAFFEGRPLTTGGRWINPFIFAHFHLEKSLPAVRTVKKPIFIVGTGRSGTTILGTVLSIHRQVGYLHEPKALWHAIYEEEDVSGNYSLGPAYYRLSAKDVSPDTKRVARRLFSAYLTIVWANRLVDKDPELIFRIPFVRAIFPDAKFVFLVRNGWNTCYSIARWSEKWGVRKDGDVHDWWGINRRKWKLILAQLVRPNPLFEDAWDVISSLNDHENMAAVEWIVTMREGMRQLETHDDCVKMFRYETLTENPHTMLGRLLDFCELPKDESLLRYAEDKLRPTYDHPRIRLHSVIEPLFTETLEQIGY